MVPDVMNPIWVRPISGPPTTNCLRFPDDIHVAERACYFTKVSFSSVPDAVENPLNCLLVAQEGTEEDILPALRAFVQGFARIKGLYAVALFDNMIVINPQMPYDNEVMDLVNEWIEEVWNLRVEEWPEAFE